MHAGKPRFAAGGRRRIIGGGAGVGFGGTFKNLAIGLATVPQKRIVHGPSFDTGAVFLERVADVAKAVFDDLGGRMACVKAPDLIAVLEEASSLQGIRRITAR